MVSQRIRRVIELVRKVQQFVLRDMWAYDTTGKRRIYTWAVHLLKLSVLVYRNLMEKRFFLRAHALTYWTLISIVPLVAVFAVALKGLGQTNLADERFWPQVEHVIKPIAPAARTMLGSVLEQRSAYWEEQEKQRKKQEAKEMAEQGAADAQAAKDTGNPALGVDTEDAAAAEDAKFLVTKIRGFVENLNTKAMGVAGFTIALLTVVSLLSKIEQGFNDIWGIRRKRTFVTRLVVYWGVVTLPTLVLVVTSGYNIATKSEKLMHQVNTLPIIGGFVRGMLPYVWVWIAFALLYIIMPNARVRLRSAIVAGVVAGTIWHIMNQGYGLYFAWMANSARFALYRVLYGSLAAVPFMLFWVYLSWAIVLFGAGVAYADQNLSVFEREGVTLLTSFGDRMFVLLRCLVAVGQAFHFDRKPLTTRSIYLSLRLPASIVYDCMLELKDLGYVTEIVSDGDDESTAYQPTSSLENYTIYDVINRMHHHGGRHFPMPDDKAKELLNDAVARIWKVTKEELADVTCHYLVLQAGPFHESKATTFQEEMDAMLEAEKEIEERQERAELEREAAGQDA